MPPIIEASHVGKTYRSGKLEVPALRDVSFSVEPGEFVYFTHSYKGPVTQDTAAVTQYIEPFAAAVERANVMGVQFHPEKSGAVGLKIVSNFVCS